MPPNPHDLKVAIGALRDAGSEWDSQSRELSTISGNTESLTMSALELGLAAPIHGVYEHLRAALQARLSEGATEAGRIGEALNHAATVYQREEDKGVHALNKVW